MSKSRRSKKGKLNRIGRRRRRIQIGLLLLLVISISTAYIHLRKADLLPANETAQEWYESNQRPQELISLPADDAPHEHYTEWWYYNGHLQAQDGKRYSFHYVLFVINRLAGHTVAHASLVDHTSGKHFALQQRTAGKPNRQMLDGFDFSFGHWKMAGSNGIDRIALEAPEFSLDLTLENINPPVLHGKTGLLDFKQAGSSYYYSRPRMRVTGTAGLAGQSQLVSGEAWFDHQWGDFRVTALAWNWFAIQLEDGRDLMLFELFTPQGEKVAHFGTLSGRGPDVTLEKKDFAIEVTERWKSQRTKIDYPMGWRITVPRQNLDLTLKPIVKNAEFDGRQSSYLIYWEGPIEVSGSQSGKGYVEMSGYQPGTAAAGSHDTGKPKDADNRSNNGGKPAFATDDQRRASALSSQINTPAEVQQRKTNPEIASTVTQERTAIVNTNSNLRAGPGTNYQIVTTLPKGSPLHVIGQQQNWLRVVAPSLDQGSKAWIYSELVSNP